MDTKLIHLNLVALLAPVTLTALVLAPLAALHAEPRQEPPTKLLTSPAELAAFLKTAYGASVRKKGMAECLCMAVRKRGDALTFCEVPILALKPTP